MNRFQQACKLVDDKIEADGIPVDAIERNKRVLGAMQQMREGRSPDGTAKLTVHQFPVPRGTA